MEKKNNEGLEKQGAKNTKDGLFTGRLAWWQIVLGFLLVGYLVYGKYQEVVVKPNSTPSSVPAKSQ